VACSRPECLASDGDGDGDDDYDDDDEDKHSDVFKSSQLPLGSGNLLKRGEKG
jgi:hypothetical protein